MISPNQKGDFHLYSWFYTLSASIGFQLAIRMFYIRMSKIATPLISCLCYGRQSRRRTFILINLNKVERKNMWTLSNIAGGRDDKICTHFCCCCCNCCHCSNNLENVYQMFKKIHTDTCYTTILLVNILIWFIFNMTVQATGTHMFR